MTTAMKRCYSLLISALAKLFWHVVLSRGISPKRQFVPLQMKISFRCFGVMISSATFSDSCI